MGITILRSGRLFRAPKIFPMRMRGANAGTAGGLRGRRLIIGSANASARTLEDSGSKNGSVTNKNAASPKGGGVLFDRDT